MSILIVNSCLCCDLLSGGITIGLLNICIGFFFLFCGLETLIIPENVAIALITLSVSGCWTYGIFAKKPHFMFPFLALNISIFIAFAIAAIVYTICIFIISDNNCSNGVWIALIIAAVIYWYVTAVLNSLYKSMKATNGAIGTNAENAKPELVCEFANV